MSAAIVKIHVGKPGESETFGVHKDLIRQHSKYFNNAFESGFSEAQRGEISLPDASVKDFRIFMH